jgi:hypothetical protein
MFVCYTGRVHFSLTYFSYNCLCRKRLLSAHYILSKPSSSSFELDFRTPIRIYLKLRILETTGRICWGEIDPSQGPPYLRRSTQP